MSVFVSERGAGGWSFLCSGVFRELRFPRRYVGGGVHWLELFMSSLFVYWTGCIGFWRCGEWFSGYMRWCTSSCILHCGCCKQCGEVDVLFQLQKMEL